MKYPLLQVGEAVSVIARDFVELPQEERTGTIKEVFEGRGECHTYLVQMAHKRNPLSFCDFEVKQVNPPAKVRKKRSDSGKPRKEKQL